MAANDHTSSELFPANLTHDELEERYLHTHLESATPQQLSDITNARQKLLSHHDKSFEINNNIWERYFYQFPRLKEVTNINYEEKKTELTAAGVPSYVWSQLEEMQKIAHKKQLVLEKEMPFAHGQSHKEAHKSHDDHQAYGPVYYDHDPHYTELVKRKLEKWNKENADKAITAPVFLAYEDGALYINPEITSTIENFEKEAKEEFAKTYAEAAATYELNEKSRIYRDKEGEAKPNNDPAYQQLQLTIAGKTKSEIQRQSDEIATKAKTSDAFSAQKIDTKAIEATIRTEELRTFISAHPTKAKAYAEKDTQLHEIYLLVATEQEQQNESESQQSQPDSSSQSSNKQVRKQLQDMMSEKSAPVEQSYIQPESPQYSQIEPPHFEPSTMSRPPLSTTQAPQSSIGGGPGGMRSRMGSPLRRLAGGGQNAASGIRNAAAGAQKVGAVVARAAPLLANPITWIVLFLLFLIILLLVMGGGNDESTSTTIPVTIIKTGPSEIANGADIPYTIQVSYPGTATDIIVTDPIPEGSTFFTASGVYSCDGATSTGPGGATNPCGPSSRTITWKLSENGGINATASASTTTATDSAKLNGISATFSITVHPTGSDTYIINQASAQVIGGSGTGTVPSAGYLPPTTTDCGGKYNLSINQFDGKNYGDPDCSLANSPTTTFSFNGQSWSNIPKVLVDTLQNLDPQNAGYWIGIISCESAFDPNNVTYFADGSATPDSGGAWGLFQMGSGVNGEYINPTTDGSENNPYPDRGDVNWTQQVSNAIQYQKLYESGGTGRTLGGYWACARSVWGFPDY